MASHANIEYSKPHGCQIPVFRDIPSIREYRQGALLSNRSVGLVPTMGALHEGHLSLIKRAVSENLVVIVSIYVNPTQFAVNEDLESYPKTWESDLKALHFLQEELSRDCLDGAPPGRIGAIFAPSTKVMYPTLPPRSEPDAEGSFVIIDPIGSLLEGASRPTFFRGVATVCMKLFNIITPEKVYFGQKDIQQTKVIERMVLDFAIATEVVIVPTIRGSDGLALSSRNVYLGSRRRRVANGLYQALKLAQVEFDASKRLRTEILDSAVKHLDSILEAQRRLPPSERALFQVDYLSLADPRTLAEVPLVEADGAILSAAIKMLPLEEAQPGEDCGLGGGTTSVRLIDNIILRDAWKA